MKRKEKENHKGIYKVMKLLNNQLIHFTAMKIVKRFIPEKRNTGKLINRGKLISAPFIYLSTTMQEYSSFSVHLGSMETGKAESSRCMFAVQCFVQTVGL